MSGSGRKSHYRKSVTSAYLSDDSRELANNEYIATVISNRGDNTFFIQFPNENQELANLPKKFNKLIWIKTGDYIIVEDNNVNNNWQTSITNQNRVKFTISHILSKSNIKYLKANNMWPPEFADKEQSIIEKSRDFLCDYHPNSIEDDGMEYEYDATEIKYDIKGNTIAN